MECTCRGTGTFTCDTLCLSTKGGTFDCSTGMEMSTVIFLIFMGAMASFILGQRFPDIPVRKSFLPLWAALVVVLRPRCGRAAVPVDDERAAVGNPVSVIGDSGINRPQDQPDLD